MLDWGACEVSYWRESAKNVLSVNFGSVARFYEGEFFHGVMKLPRLQIMFDRVNCLITEE